MRSSVTEERIARALAAHSIRVIKTSLEGLRNDLDRLVGSALLIYDLAPWNDTTSHILQNVRFQYPLLVILAYPPVKPGVGRVITRAVSIPGVSLKLHFDDAAEVDRLRVTIGQALQSTPVWCARQTMNWLIPSLPSGAHVFLEAAFAAIAGNRSEHVALSARAIARRLGLNSRTIERACSAAALPPPRETLDWLLMLTLTLAGGIMGRPTVAIAKALGVSKRRLKRLRERLIVTGFDPSKTGPAAEFDISLILFARRCGIAEHCVAEARERLQESLLA